ncbi:Putative niacin/nicotinamide transporter NaiP [Corynebacterium provencense]|uniref:Niacin/nicotinamide transporter NaiP n=1 Tax=Corynebacterium provencense TaxID=1737425 RepID=A0A2Z3YZJ5_9CORY|nr:MFS transporter [Corynebacterium provencense]AWT26743.1 Putative niacin/nicotinamide transporter NaiP [Corynebacterium provencense]
MTHSTTQSTPRGQRHAFVAAYLGWMFDGYETFATVLIATSIVNDLVGPGSAARSPYYVSGILAVTLFSWCIGGLVSGIIADRYGRRRVLMVSILWYAIFAGLTAIAPSFLLLLVLRFLTGLGMGAEWGGGSSLVSETAPARHRGFRIALLQSGFGVGFLLATGAWQLINNGHPGDWRWMYALGVIPALLILYIRKAASDSPLWTDADRQRRDISAAEQQGSRLDDETRNLLRPTLHQLLASAVYRRRLILLTIGSLSSLVGWWAVSTWIPAHATKLLAGTGPGVASSVSLIVLSYNVAGIVGYLVNGYLADVVGRKPVILFFFVASVVATPCLFLIPQSFPGLVFWAAFNGFFTLGQWTWLALYPGELFPTNVRATAMTVVFNFARLPAAIGTLISASLIHALGSISTAAIVIGCSVYGIGALVTWFMGPETRGTELPRPKSPSAPITKEVLAQ